MTPEAPWSREARFPDGEAPAGPLRVQVAVVGNGPAALAAAGALQAGGAEVALLPPAPWASAAVCTGAGVALPALAEHYSALCRDLGREQARSWWGLAAAGAAALRARLAGEDCDLRRGGVLLLPASEAEYAELVEGLPALADDGFAPRMMGAAAATNYLPVEVEPGVMYLAGAATFDPVRALAALARQSLAAGVRVLPPLDSLSWRVDGAGVHLAGEGREVLAEVAVLAEGAPRETVDRWLFPLRGQLLATGRVREGMTDITVAAVASRGHEVYRSGPGGGMVGSGINPSSGPKERTTDLQVDAEFQGFLENLMNQRFPEARRTAVTSRWATSYDSSADGLPLAGPLPGQARVHVLAGFGSTPWSLAWGAGEALASILGGGADRLPDRAGPRRFLG